MVSVPRSTASGVQCSSRYTNTTRISSIVHLFGCFPAVSKATISGGQLTGITFTSHQAPSVQFVSHPGNH